MKRAPLLFLLASLVTPAVAQNGGNFDVGRVKFSALRMQNEGSLVRCRGDVVMASDSFVLRADEVDYHSDTGVAEARGNVRIQLLPSPPLTLGNLKFRGFGIVPNDTTRRAFFTDGDDVYIVGEGDELLKRFRILRIGNRSVEFEEISSGRVGTAPLVEAQGGPQ
jgi:lipopolysaccharide assembly outer membrane protein LptD (OstA)